MTKPQNNMLFEDAEEETAGLDTRVAPMVRVINGALDEDENGNIILNGRIDPSTLRFLKVDGDYQRPLGDRSDIWTALKDGTVVPNIEIGVRGQDFETVGDDFIIRSPAYVIDGWQRVGTANKILEQLPNHPMRIFGSFHFGTDAVWERHRFTELNKNTKRVSPNLHLRNMRDSSPAILTLYGLSNNQGNFALYKKVCWSQNMGRGQHLLSALVLAKTAMRLHAHHTAIANTTVSAVAGSLATVVQAVPLDQFRKNVVTFFDVIDECWGIASVEYRHAAPQIKTQFLWQLARAFSGHIDFWDSADRIFFVSAEMRRKLTKFPVNDPHIRHLAGSGGTAGNILYDLLVKHINSGRRTGQIRPRIKQ